VVDKNRKLHFLDRISGIARIKSFTNPVNLVDHVEKNIQKKYFLAFIGW
jgi:hypothetical protein